MDMIHHANSCLDCVQVKSTQYLEGRIGADGEQGQQQFFSCV